MEIVNIGNFYVSVDRVLSAKFIAQFCLAVFRDKSSCMMFRDRQ